jgi:predicted enzyme related to lactoylglutathione lyase
MSINTSATSPSDFVWYEFHTPDAASAAAFYSAVLGWGTHDAGRSDRSYTFVTVGNIPIGGLLQKPAASFANGAKPGWMGYIAVDDLDKTVKRVQQAGGIVHHAMEPIPGVGSFAVVADPQDAIFVLFQPNDASSQERPAPGTPGSAAWHDLAAIDWESDFNFYSSLFGWTKADAVPMGASGVYQLFATGGAPIGGMMNRMDPAQSPGWFYYFHVDEIGAAVARVKQHGGTMTHGPSVVPGGQQIAHCLDPQGGAFGIVTPRS